MEGEIIKKKRAPSEWAIAVSKHMKAGGKFPKKGTADYEAVRALMPQRKDEKLGEEVAVLKREVETPKKTKRMSKTKTPEAVPADIPKEVVKEVMEKLPVATKKKLKAEKADIVVGAKMPIAHVLPLAKLDATQLGIKLPFSV